jgi:branched-chain amino acid transport system substrate-binding protein
MRNYIRWLVVLTLAVALLATVGTSCSDDTEGGEEVYKVGAVFATTGGASNLGVPEKQTVEMIVEQINSAGL